MNRSIYEIVVIVSLVYLSYALLHHHKRKNLKLEIFIEYVLIALLILVVLQGLLI